jgi:hypothetical protein
MKKLGITFLVAFAFSPIAYADSVEEFIKNALLNKLEEKHFHPEAKCVQQLGDVEYVLTRDQLVEYFKSARSTGAKAHIVSFEILSTYETDGIISVVTRSKVRQVIGSMVIEGDVVSHDILKRAKDSFVSVFSVARQ